MCREKEFREAFEPANGRGLPCCFTEKGERYGRVFPTFSPSGAAAPVVSPEPAHPALAGGPPALSGVGVGDHAPADPGGGRPALLRALSAGAAGHSGTGCRPGGAAPQALGGAGVLQPGAQPPEGGPGGVRTVRRRAARRLRGGKGAARHRRVHRRGHLFHRLWPAYPGGGRQCAAGGVPHHRRRNPGGFPSAQAAVPGRNWRPSIRRGRPGTSPRR